MTPHQKRLVQTSFAQVAPIAETAAALFYAKLFELDPSLRPMFTADLKEQGRKLMQMLAVAMRGLDNLEALVPAVRALGQRHAGYGVRDEDYGTVAVALLATLELGLGEAFTPAVREAWATVYWLLADTMQAGAAGETLAKSA
jgi:hemoglobin-like flavoprotein